MENKNAEQVVVNEEAKEMIDISSDSGKKCGNAKTVLAIVGMIVLFAAVFIAGWFIGKDGVTVTITSGNAETASTEENKDNDTEPETVLEAQNETVVIDETNAAGETVAAADDKSEHGNAASEAVAGDPTSYNTAQVLDYFNIAMNKVRKVKPGFEKVNNKKYSFTSKSANDKAMSILTNIAASAMKGDEKTTVQKGSDNTPYLASDSRDWASKLKESDVQSAKITKSGENYKVTIRLIDGDINPKKDGQSTYSRFFDVNTKAEMADMLSDFTIKTTTDNLTLNYRGGYIEAVIDKNGNMVSLDYDVMIDMIMKNPKVAILNMDDLTVTVDVKRKASNFVW